MDYSLNPKLVFFEKDALDYPRGKDLYEKFKKSGLKIDFLKSHNRVTGIPGKTPREAFFHGKSTLVVGIRRTLDFAGCKPSAHYQLPLVTGCQGICEYCYLNTQLGKKPYTRIYVNVEEILAQAEKYIKEREPELTLFEAAATSDPVPVEPFTGALAEAIDFFASQENARLRFVTKYPHIDSLLHLQHRGHTRIRFSINTDRIIKQYEHRTPEVSDRLDALSRVLSAAYPGGVIIAPVIMSEKWQDEYSELLDKLERSVSVSGNEDLHFEVISHRFTRRAKTNILEVFPESGLPMDENESRTFKYGQFGYGKFVYNKEMLAEMKDFFQENLTKRFPRSKIDYII